MKVQVEEGILQAAFFLVAEILVVQY